MMLTSRFSLSKGGATKQELASKLSLSRQQLRRHTAELVDMEYLAVDLKRNMLVTTDKGILLLQKKAGIF